MQIDFQSQAAYFAKEEGFNRIDESVGDASPVSEQSQGVRLCTAQL